MTATRKAPGEGRGRRPGRRRWVGSLVLVVAAALGPGACESATGPQYVAKVLLEPDSAHLEPGESVTFGAVPLGPLDQRYPDRASRVEWSLFNPDVAELEILESGVRVTAKGVGSARVEAELGRGSGSASVFVRPPGLASIEMDPANLVLQSFTGRQVRAVLRDASGAQMSPEGFRISWASSNLDVLRIVPNTAVTPFATVSGRNPGSATLRLVVGPMSIATRVTVVPR